MLKALVVEPLKKLLFLWIPKVYDNIMINGKTRDYIIYPGVKPYKKNEWND